MKLFIICCLVAFGTSHATDDYVHQGFDEAGNMSSYGKLVLAAKRYSGSSSGFRRGAAGNDTLCSPICIMEPSSNLRDAEYADFIDKNRLPFRFDGKFNPNNLRIFCSSTNSSIACIRPCPSGEMKEILESFLILPRYICIESSLMQHAECIHGVHKEQLATCDSKCSAIKSSVETLERRMSKSLRDIENVLGQTCEYLDCDSECDSSKVSQKCGAEAAKAYLGYYKKWTDAAKAALEAFHIEISIPVSCNSVGIADDV